MNFITGTVDKGKFKSSLSSFSLKGYKTIKKDFSGKVELGIRPEHIKGGAGASKCSVSYEGTVEMVEPLGSDTLARVKVKEHLFWVRVDGQFKLSAGDILPIGFEPVNAHLFDTNTDLRV